ncbi:hypothetical protein EVAR_35413_1 [Eumeta japonica]|uniref:Uncharacterized protein n=1 Tax=Eumeta variegata TaxID=151549 RepID=A0A4C1XAQ3_EUMVA|nr:hypothetical protein EVAR_35413_1 [Eumeta japonica]
MSFSVAAVLKAGCGTRRKRGRAESQSVNEPLFTRVFLRPASATRFSVSTTATFKIFDNVFFVSRRYAERTLGCCGGVPARRGLVTRLLSVIGSTMALANNTAAHAPRGNSFTLNTRPSLFLIILVYFDVAE